MPLDEIAQFVTILLIFVFVLAATYFTTKWIARYQRVKSAGTNIEVVETCRISGTKYVQILRIGKRYVAVAVCKDTVTRLTELSPDEITREPIQEGDRKSFKEIFELLKNKKSNSTIGRHNDRV